MNKFEVEVNVYELRLQIAAQIIRQAEINKFNHEETLANALVFANELILMNRLTLDEIYEKSSYIKL